MYQYKCDICGDLIYIDPAEKRLCDECLKESQSDTEDGRGKGDHELQRQNKRPYALH